MCCKSAFRSTLRDSPWRIANEAANGFTRSTVAVALVMAAEAADALLQDNKLEESFV